MVQGSQESDGILYGAVGVLRRSGQFLLIRRADGIRAGGKWCFPGGEVEPGETSDQAVVREMWEEVGLTVRAVQQVWRFSRDDGAGRLVLDWWTVEEETGEEVRPNPAEVAEARWVTAEQIRANPDVLPGLLQFLDRFYPAG